MTFVTERKKISVPARKSTTKKNCGECKRAGHSARVCEAAAKASAERVADTTKKALQR